ncbi:hypothetical protein F3Y22_tig00111582pilonHSYRG00178 [Hibiscus syriacus]|uniref:Uncharacterized protein n=1 Tax=Hibiscus syriacus TaxID=106335 RepID=A0A6A2YGW1_HIBSY|nr:hypothetical protein F3Y22_tig00111582pilonHSYRG00178 [Hibiscus syriacus]
MEKFKRLPLGVQKKTTSTKQITKKKKLFSNVLNYLKSDCCMFAPLLYPSLSGLKSKEPIKENKKTRVLKMVGNREITVETAMRTLTTESANATAEKQPCEDAPRAVLGHGETVKHMVYHQRRRCSTPVSAGGILKLLQMLHCLLFSFIVES